MRILKRRIILALLVVVVTAGFLAPERLVIPVAGGKTTDWNHKTFWYEPWGRSIVHKGIDIFASKGTPALSAVDGVVVYSGHLGIGGNIVVVLGPKWRAHYFAHLDRIDISPGTLVRAGQQIGAVGDSGNAAGKPPHVHYSIFTPFPHLWLWDQSTLGWLKMFFLDPGAALLGKVGSEAG